MELFKSHVTKTNHFYNSKYSNPAETYGSILWEIPTLRRSFQKKQSLLQETNDEEMLLMEEIWRSQLFSDVFWYSVLDTYCKWDIHYQPLVD